MSEGDRLKDLLLLYRNTAFQYKLSEFADESLIVIQKALDKARNDLFYELGKKDFRLPTGREEDLLEELNRLTLGIQGQLTGDIREASIIAGEYSLKEYQSILSFEGKLDTTVGFNRLSLSPAQLAAMVDVPVGGKLLEAWVSDIFSGRISDEIQTLVMAGNLQGLSTPKIVKGMEEAFGMVKKDAETLTRTYIASINNQAAQKVYKENADIIKSEIWNSSLEVGMSGRSTCARCGVLDGREYQLDEDHIRPPLHPRCVTAESIIFAPDITHLMESKYSGPIVELCLSDGTMLSVTSNHMLMTPNGLVMARFLTDADYLLCCGDFKGVVFGDPNDNRNNLRIDNVIKSFSKTFGMSASSVPMSTEYFHGDGINGDKDVNIINANSFLIDNVNSKFLEHFTSNSLSPVDSARLFPAYGDIATFFKSFLDSSHLSIGFSREFFAFCQWSLRHSEEHGFASGSGLDSIVFQKPMYSSPGNSELFSKCFCRHSVIEETDGFVRVKLSIATPFILKNRESITLEPAFNGVTIHADHAAKFFNRNTFFVKLMKFININVWVRKVRINKRLLTKPSYGNPVRNQDIANRSIRHFELFCNVRNRISMFIVAYYRVFIKRKCFAYSNLLRMRSYFHSVLDKYVFNSFRCDVKLNANFKKRFPRCVKRNYFRDKRFKSGRRFFFELKTTIYKRFAKFFSVDTIPSCDTGNTFPGNVSPIKIVNVNIKHVNNLPVYDVSTLSSSYIVNGVLSSNCRCFMLPKTKSYKDLGLNVPEMRESLRVFSERGENRKIINAGLYDGDFKNFLDSRSAKYKIDLLGKNRYMLLQQNKIKWDDLVNANGELRLLKKNKDGKYTGLQK